MIECELPGQNLRQFVFDLEQHRKVRKLYIITHLIASWISLNDSSKINNASKSNTSSAQACTRGSSCWAARMSWCAWSGHVHPKCVEECAEHDSAEFCTSRCTAISMLLKELRTRRCLRPLRRRCEAKKGVQRHPHRRKCRARAKTWCVAHARVRGPKVKCKNEVKQQQD